MTYTSSSFYTINNKSISVKRSNFTLAFFKAACHANSGPERNFEGSIYLFIYSFSYLFRKHKYKFTNTSIQTQVIILNKNMFAGSL